MLPTSGEPGIVIVTHNSSKVLASCLDSALARSSNVVVVDNNSSDDTCATARSFPSQLIANKDNKGFATAVNQGVNTLKGCQAILLLNPDARLVSPLEPMLERLHKPGVGAVGGRLISEDGRDQQGFALRRFPTTTSLIFECLGINRLWPGNWMNRRFRALDVDLSECQPAEQPAGAFLLFSRSLWTRLHGFDERFHPLWFEDVDFLQRTAKAGYQIWYEPAVRAIHLGAHSLESLQPADRQRFWYGNLLRYASIHLESGFAVRLLAASVLVGVGIRRLVAWGGDGSRRQMEGPGAAGLAFAHLKHGRFGGEDPVLTGKNDKKANSRSLHG